MKKYHRFLNAMPEFLGISFPEVGIILASLWLCLIFGFPSYYAIIFVVVGIGTSKIIKRYFDFVGFLVPRKNQIYLKDFKKEEE